MYKGNKVEKIQYIKVRKEKGQDLLRLISNKFKKTPLIDKKSKVVRENDFILFPIIENKILIEILVNLINNFDFECPNCHAKFNQPSIPLPSSSMYYKCPFCGMIMEGL